MDTRLEKDPPATTEESNPARRFRAQVEEMDATYPMLAPAAAVMVASEDEDAFQSELLGGLVT